MSNLALVIITTSFPTSGDGSEAAGSFVSDMAEELAKHVPVRVVAPGTDTKREPWAEGVEVFRFASPDKPLSTLKPWVPSDLLAIRRVLTAGEAATRQATASPTAHILALWALPSGHWARRVSRDTSVPYSVWTLGSDIWNLGRIPLVRSHLRNVLRDAHTCYSDGLKLAADTSTICGRDVEFLPSTRRILRTRTIPLKSEPPYRLLFLGRWHPNKGVDLLLDALMLLTDSDWRRIEAVEICGGGPLEQLVKQRASELQAMGHPIEIRGYLDKAAAEEAILYADYLLIPSRIESIPVVFSDAMKLECPVVAMPVGDLRELIGKFRAGITAAHLDATDYAQAIVKALGTPASSFKVGLDRTAEVFSLSDVAKRLTNISQQEWLGDIASSRRGGLDWRQK